ncbi:MAG TPA: TonB-dependent receptor [Longimicrobiales bacterium]|nr:TonB-dependent receptor [Longimicrobiales bacterium]
MPHAASLYSLRWGSLLALTFLFSPHPAIAQTAVVAGTVAEAESLQPIVNAEVRVAGTNQVAVTNASGRFTLAGVAAGSRTLQITALGYQAEDVGVTASGAAETRVTILMSLRPIPVERVVVTAFKSPVSAVDVAAFTTVIDREQVALRGDVELVDALENATGLMHTAQVGHFESIELRGMPRGGNEFESTLLLVDGVPQTDSRNSARVIGLPIENAAAIEVVHGPNSALYGRTAIGGAINVLTAQPTPSPRATAELQVGEFGHIKGAMSASGPVEDWAGYYVSWSSTEGDGYYSGDPTFDVDETSIFAKLTFTTDPNGVAMVSVNRVTSDNSMPASIPVTDGQPLSDVEPAFDVFTNLNLPTANYHHEDLRLTANYDRQLGSDVTFKNIFGYRETQHAFEESGDILEGLDTAAGTVVTLPFSLQTDEDVIYEEARLSYRPSAGPRDHELMLGGSFERTTGFRSGYFIYTDPGLFGWEVDYLDPVHPDRSTWTWEQFGGDDYSLDSYGLYAQYRITPIERLTLTAAGRYDRMELTNIETFQAQIPDTSETFDAFSPKVSALVRVLDGQSAGTGPLNLNVYATYSEAFKPPRIPHQLVPAGTNPSLDPETIRNVEVGAKSLFADGRASLSASYFHMKRDGIVINRRSGPFFIPSNAGQQDFDGVEVGADWSPMAQLTLSGNAALYRNRFGDFVVEGSSGDLDLTDNRLPLVPDLIFNLGATLRPRDDLALTAGLKHVGDRYLDQENTYLLDPYTLVDASVSWAPGPLRFTLSARNLFDERFFQNGDTSTAETVEVGMPRQVVMSVMFTHD